MLIIKSMDSLKIPAFQRKALKTLSFASFFFSFILIKSGCEGALSEEELEGARARGISTLLDISLVFSSTVSSNIYLNFSSIRDMY